MAATEQERATWTAAYVNNLPDSHFLYVESGGTKDGEGKTVPRSLRHFPYKDASGAVDLPHLRNALARIPQSNLPQSVKDRLTEKAQNLLANENADDSPRDQTPRENLYRSLDDIGLDRAEGDGPPVMFGHFSRFNEWTRIHSIFEGEFMERIAPGAFKKTIAENRAGLRVLFQHGRDPQVGAKPLGKITELREDGAGAYYEVELFDASYVRDLIPAIRGGEVGSSFAFNVMREEWTDKPEISDYNPQGLPERTIKEVQLREFGPVTFPAYSGATAGIRSITDEVLGIHTERDDTPANGEAATLALDLETVTTTATDAAPPHPAETEPRRGTQPEPSPKQGEEEKHMITIDEMRARLGDIATELKEISSENYGQLFDGPTQQRWDTLTAEREDIEARVKATEERQAYLETIAQDPTRIDKPHGETRGGTGTFVTRQRGRDQIPENVFAIEQYHQLAQSREQLGRLYHDGARAAMEGFHYPHPQADEARANERIERLLEQDASGEMAQRVLLHGSPHYRAAYWKTNLKQPLSREEQSALAAGMMLEDRAITTTNTSGVTVPITIDPTIIPVSNGVLNPVRAISRVRTITSAQLQSTTSTGVTATRRAEGAAMADNAPTLVSPTVTPTRVDVFIPFSWEAAADWGSLEADLAVLIADAKDVEECDAFVNGNGTAPNPKGFMTYAGTVLGTAATVVVGTVDLLALQDALPARYQANATWLMAPAMTSKVRALTSTAQGSWWAESLQVGAPSMLLGYPIYKCTTVGTAGSGSPPVASVKWAIIGDFRSFEIVDRVGMQTRYIDNLFSGNTAGAFGYPVGMSGLVAYYRNGCNILTSNAFRVGTVT